MDWSEEVGLAAGVAFGPSPHPQLQPPADIMFFSTLVIHVASPRFAAANRYISKRYA
jgi:hypothetical protein